jgi:hypothetical protein
MFKDLEKFRGLWRFFSLVEKSGRGVRLTTHLHMISALRISGTTPPFFLYAFVARTDTNLS